MNRRSVGWLLLLASPGFAVGVTLTAFGAVRLFAGNAFYPVADVLAFVDWALAGIGSAAGGILLGRRAVTKALLAMIGGAFGVALYAASMMIADLVTTWF